MIVVWVLFVFGSGTPSAYSYDSKKDCERAAAIYKKAVCMPVKVEKP